MDDIAYDDYEKLKAENLSLKQELENTSQELYECKRNVNVLRSLQLEYQNEIDMLQSEEIRQKQKYQGIIKQLEQDIHNMRDSHSEEKQTFENVIMKMEEKNELMRIKLDDYKDSYNTTSFAGDTSSLINEILSDPPEFYENQQLKDTVKELQSTVEFKTKIVEECEKEIENLKGSLECTRADLLEANKTNQFLNDEILCLTSELDSLKNQPLNKDSQGNSLFAEVDDRRVYLQDKINKMKATYIAITQEKAQLNNTIHQLQLENLRLIERFKLDVEEKEDDDHSVEVALRSRVKDMEKLIEKYKKELLEKPVVFTTRNFEEIEYYSVSLTEKNKEIQSWKDMVSEKSLERFLLATELRKSNDEKRKWRIKSMSTQHELELLQRKIASKEQGKEIDNEINKENSSSDSRNSLKKREENSKKSTADESGNRNLEECRSKSSLKERLSDIQEDHSTTENPLKDKTNVTSPNTITEPIFTVTRDETYTPEVEHKHNTSNKRRESMLIEKNESVYADKENISEDKDLIANQTRRVTFAENTLSPKMTGRRAGKRVYVGKPVHFTDDVL